MQPELTNKPDQESVVVIRLVHQLTAHYWIKTKLSNGLLILAEIACYLLGVSLVIIAIVIPNGTIPIAEWVSDGNSRQVNLKMEEIISVFLILKITIGVLGILMIIPAVLFRKVRKKNYVLEEVNSITGEFLKTQISF